jgi:WD40 repeat protein
MTAPSDWVRSSAFSPDGSTLATACPHNTEVYLWDARTGKPLRELQGHSAPVHVVAYSPDGTTLASGGDDKTVRL